MREGVIVREGKRGSARVSESESERENEQMRERVIVRG